MKTRNLVMKIKSRASLKDILSVVTAMEMTATTIAMIATTTVMIATTTAMIATTITPESLIGVKKTQLAKNDRFRHD